ncbi:unnamed protein product [Peronospora destructor]|uniref:G domain-containing protein n=1 Tax=Peronospora destructor TaxID=86335 RepID=A0AAV0SXK4_9STRA|nr:unnamed protein product [Peronospora destructor]
MDAKKLKLTVDQILNHEYEKRVMELRSKDMLMIQLVDILAFPEWNKEDLVPTKSGIRRLMRRIKQETNYREAGIENVISIYLISAMKRIGMKEIVEDVAKYREGRDICVVGAVNVGKSTFLNSFLSHLVDRKWQHNHRKYMKMTEMSLSELENEETAVMLNHDEEVMEETSAEKEKRAFAEDGTTFVTPHGELLRRLRRGTRNDRDECGGRLENDHVAASRYDPGRPELIEVLALDGAAKLKNVFPSKQLPVTTYRSMLLLSWYGVLSGHLTSTERAEDTFVKHAGGILSPPRGLDAMSFTGPLTLSQNVYSKDYALESALTKFKHKKPKRTTVVELSGFGWLSVTGVDLDGTTASQTTLDKGKIFVHTCRGLSVVPRAPLFPYEMSDSKSR